MSAVISLGGKMIELNHFQASEFTDISKMNSELLMGLEELRFEIMKPISIHESNPTYDVGVHVSGSLHFKGCAVDCSCKYLSLWDFFLAATRFSCFTGIGVYPYWNTPGLHLERNDKQRIRKYWWRDRDGEYRALSTLNVPEAFQL